MSVISFTAKRNNKIKSNYLSLECINIDKEKYISDELYTLIDDEYKAKQEFCGDLVDYLICEDDNVYETLCELVSRCNLSSPGWMVYTENHLYTYVCHKKRVFMISKETFAPRSEAILNEFGVDNLLVLEKMKENTYRVVYE